MFRNKFLDFGAYLVASVVLAIVMCVTFTNAEYAVKDNKDFKQVSSTNEELSTPHNPELDVERNVEELEVEEEIEEFEIPIKGMTCASCEAKLNEVLLKCTGVKTASSSYKEGKVVIMVNIDLIDDEEIVNAVENAGFSIVYEE